MPSIRSLQSNRDERKRAVTPRSAPFKLTRLSKQSAPKLRDMAHSLFGAVATWSLLHILGGARLSAKVTVCQNSRHRPTERTAIMMLRSYTPTYLIVREPRQVGVVLAST